MTETKTYELGYLLSPLVPAEQLTETATREVKQVLERAGAKIKTEIAPRSRTLAYPIKKTVEHKSSIFREAYFGAVRFTAPPEALTAVETGLKKSPLLVRFLIVTLPPRALAPAVPRRGARTEKTPPPPGGPGLSPKMTMEAIDKEIEQLLTPATS